MMDRCNEAMLLFRYIPKMAQAFACAIFSFLEDNMLDNKSFDLWTDGYDRSVGLSDEENTYPFAGYKKELAAIYEAVRTGQGNRVLDIGFGTGVLAYRL